MIRKFLPKRLKEFLKRFIKVPFIPAYSLEKRISKLKQNYLLCMHKELNLDDPVLFTEKIQWLKLFYCSDEMKRCVDKVLFKDYIKEKLGGGYTAPVIKVWNTPEEVDIKSITAKKFVLKSNLQSDGKFIILVKNSATLDIKKTEKEIKTSWFDDRLLLTNSFCSAYYGAKPKVIVEEYIEEFSGASNDYKIFCFNGIPKIIYVAEDHFIDGKTAEIHPITFLDLNWNVLDVRYGNNISNPNIQMPKHFNEMMKIATKLSKDFPFVRVDFFDTKNKLYLSELTFYPGGGLVPYNPQNFDKKLGDMLKLPKRNLW